MWKKSKFCIIGLFKLGLLLLCLLLNSVSLAGQTDQLNINIVGTVNDKENGHLIEAAKISLKLAGSSINIEAISDSDGKFNIVINRPGLYTLTVSHAGFYEAREKNINITRGEIRIDIQLIPEKTSVFSINVYAEQTATIDVSQVELKRSMTDRLIDLLPISGGYKNLRNIIGAQPGIFKDPRSNLLYFEGSRPNETNYLLNGLNVSDPSRGGFNANIGVETVKELSLVSSRYLVEYGPGGGGTVNIESKFGGDRFRWNITNFLPGFEFTKRFMLNNWGPKINFSGPINDKLRCFNGTNIDYVKNIFSDQQPTSSWDLSNLSGCQAIISPRNILTTGLLLNYFYAPLNGLSPIDPPETTRHIREIRTFFYVKDQYAFSIPHLGFSKVGLLEFGYGRYRSYLRETPQGTGFLEFFPDRREGNAFQNIRLHSNRDELNAKVSLPVYVFKSGPLKGEHQIKFGANINLLGQDQDIRRTGYRHHRLDGSVKAVVVFGGNGKFNSTNTTTSLFLQDIWAYKPWLIFGGGLRWDQNRKLSNGLSTLRFNASFLPPFLGGHTKFTAGWGLIPEDANLSFLTRGLDQYTISTNYNKDGSESAKFAQIFSNSRNRLRFPTITNSSFGVEQDLVKNIRLQFNYLRKRENNGFFFDLDAVSKMDFPEQNLYGIEALIYRPRNERVFAYNSFEFAVTKKTLLQIGSGNKAVQIAFEFFSSYSRSSARSNAALDYWIDTPIRYVNLSGKLPWDIPNRLVFWGTLDVDKTDKNDTRTSGIRKLIKNSALVYFWEWRDGTPYTLNDDEGTQIGIINDQRFPRYSSLNLKIEKIFTAYKNYQWQIRLGCENITNRENPVLINSNISSPYFGNLYGKHPRRYVIGIRFLGKK